MQTLGSFKVLTNFDPIRFGSVFGLAFCIEFVGRVWLCVA